MSRTLEIRFLSENETAKTYSQVRRIPLWSYTHSFKNGLYPLFLNKSPDDIVEIVQESYKRFVVISYSISQDPEVQNKKMQDILRQKSAEIKNFIGNNEYYFSAKQHSLVYIGTNGEFKLIKDQDDFDLEFPAYGLGTFFWSYEPNGARVCKFTNPDPDKYRTSHLFLTLCAMIVSETISLHPKWNSQMTFAKQFLTSLATEKFRLLDVKISEELLEMVEFPTAPDEAVRIPTKVERFRQLYFASLEQLKKENRKNTLKRVG